MLGLQSTKEEMIGCIYWLEGATEVASGAKNLTLLQFEEKYTSQLIQFAKQYEHSNVWSVYKRLPEADQQDPKLQKAMRALDSTVNVNWPLMHYKSAVRYLQRDPDIIAATGGTNWQKYLPPKFQKRIFYPQLWSETETAEWGKSWVEAVLN